METSGYHSIGLLFFLASSIFFMLSLLWTVVLTAKLAGYGHLNQAHHFCLPWFGWPDKAKECSRTKETSTFKVLKILLSILGISFVMGILFTQVL